jgi:hypothetical protein
MIKRIINNLLTGNGYIIVGEAGWELLLIFLL